MSDRPMNDLDTEDRLRAWLHAEATHGATAPAPLRERVREIPTVVSGRGWDRMRRGSLRSISAVAATVVIATALTAVGLGLAQPFLATPPDDTATIEELDQAITSAIEALVESPGVEGVQLSYIDEHLAAAVWFDSRPNGDVAVVQRRDLDVAETGWWLNPTGGPPATGRNIVTTVWVLAGDAFYQATLRNGQPEDGWSVTGRDAAPRGPLSYGLLILTEEDYPFPLGLVPTGDEEVTHEGSPDGGSVWTVTAPYRDGSAVVRWHIRPSGELESWSFELVGVSPLLEAGTGPTTSGRIEFMPLSDPDPISAPDVEADLDLSQFDLPGDFPLGSD